ncbi:MAG: hypothetical protein IJD90_01155 [Clostridia bacterium]|nr:hypothetical protein [Clostridia bacterium]
MRKLLAIILSMLMVFAAMPIAMVSAEETQYSYVTLEDFELHTVNTSYATGKKVSDRITNGWNGNGRVTDDATYLNPETGSTLAYKIVNNKLTYNNGGAAFLQLGLTSEQLVDSIGFRFYVKGDSTVCKPVQLGYTISVNGKNENYKANTGVSVAAVQEGTWVTVKWGDQDSKGMNWYHNGNSKWAYEVQPASVMTALSSLSIAIQTYITANEPAQTFYVDDFQMIYPYTGTATSVKVTIDGEEVAEVDYEGTYTIPTPPTHYSYTDGKNIYVGGEEVVLTKDLKLTSVIETSKVVYTMDEGSRIVGGSTTSCTPGAGVYEEIDGDWVLKLPSKADQTASFVLPEKWYHKEDFKAVKVEFSISGSSGAAGNVQYVTFGNGEETVSIVNGYTSMASKYSVDVNADIYDYNIFKVFLKGGSNFVSAKDYIYIDDVTVTFEYDFNYVAPEEDGETTDVVKTDTAASIRLGEVNGIRFYTTIDTAALAELVGDKEYEVGTLIAPKDISGDYLTIEDDHKKVVYDMSNGLWEGNQIVGSIIDIRDHNIARDFVARAYVLVDGVYYYSDTQSVRSLAYVADAYINDATSNYAELDADTKALVDAWASKFNG